MKLRSEDILTKTFTKRTFGGYSSIEVAEFLRSVSEEFDEQVKENEKLSHQLREKDHFIRECRDREALLKEVMISAQKIADNVKKEAEKQANELLKDARSKADLMVQDARDSLKSAYQDLSNLKRIHVQLKNTLQAVLQSHQDLLEEDPMHSILPASMQMPGSESLIEEKMTESLNQAVQSKDDL